MDAQAIDHDVNEYRDCTKCGLLCFITPLKLLNPYLEPSTLQETVCF